MFFRLHSSTVQFPLSASLFHSALLLLFPPWAAWFFPAFRWLHIFIERFAFNWLSLVLFSGSVLRVFHCNFHSEFHWNLLSALRSSRVALGKCCVCCAGKLTTNWELSLRLRRLWVLFGLLGYGPGLSGCSINIKGLMLLKKGGYIS